MKRDKRTGRGMRPIMAAVFAALVFSATWIHVPVGFGNVNLGDAMILTAAFTLNSPWAICAAGVGAMLADLAAGYAVYAPGTLLIKALVALVAWGGVRLLRGFSPRVRRILSGSAAELVMMVGYFVYEGAVLAYGWQGALLGLPLNAVQGVLGIAVCELLMTALRDRDLTDRG